MLPDALLWYSDLVTSVTIDSDLLLRIFRSQEVAMGELWLQLQQVSDYIERGFCV